LKSANNNSCISFQANQEQCEMANDVELTLKLTADSLGQALKELTEILASQTTTGSSEESLKVVNEHIEGIKRRDISRIAATVADSFALTSDTLPTYGFSSRTTDRQGYMQLWQGFSGVSLERCGKPPGNVGWGGRNWQATGCSWL
jgi:hypothetical protein